MGELRPKDVVVRLFANPMPPMPMQEGMQHAYTMRNKSGDVLATITPPLSPPLVTTLQNALGS